MYYNPTEHAQTSTYAYTRQLNVRAGSRSRRGCVDQIWPDQRKCASAGPVLCVVIQDRWSDTDGYIVGLRNQNASVDIVVELTKIG